MFINWDVRVKKQLDLLYFSKFKPHAKCSDIIIRRRTEKDNLRRVMGCNFGVMLNVGSTTPLPLSIALVFYINDLKSAKLFNQPILC